MKGTALDIDGVTAFTCLSTCRAQIVGSLADLLFNLTPHHKVGLCAFCAPVH